MIYGKNKVNNEIYNIDCDIDVDVKKYATKHIKIVNDKQVEFILCQSRLANQWRVLM